MTKARVLLIAALPLLMLTACFGEAVDSDIRTIPVDPEDPEDPDEPCVDEDCLIAPLIEPGDCPEGTEYLAWGECVNLEGVCEWILYEDCAPLDDPPPPPEDPGADPDPDPGPPPVPNQRRPT